MVHLPNHPLLARARRGECVTLIDKIEFETDLDVLNAMQKAIAERGQRLTMEELRAFSTRRGTIRSSV